MKRTISWLMQPITLTVVFTALITLALDVNANDKPVSYEGAQLWRINNIPVTDGRRRAISLPDVMEKHFDVNIWKDGSDYFDISVEKKHLDAAKAYLKHHNIEPEILNANIQNLFDSEASIHSHRTKRATNGGMTWNNYHDINTIYNFLHEMSQKYPKICTLFRIGETAEGRDLFVLRISENPTANKKIFIDGGIHAREWVSPATVTYIINNLLADWQNQPDYIKQKTWLIMPVVNPDGYEYSRNVNRLWRKNRNPNPGKTCMGVDINRNFDIAWNAKGSSVNACSDIYRGTSAGSELETRALTKFLREQSSNLEAYLTYHSYSQALVYPWAFKAEYATNYHDLQRVGDLAVERIWDATKTAYRCDVTHRVFGIAGGGSDDWTKYTLNTKYVYTVEMRDRGEYGFALPPDQIMDAGREGLIIATTVAENI